jgi:hypothetical protein
MTERRTSGISPLTVAWDLLSARLRQLEDRIRQGDEASWDPYLATLTTMTTLLAQTSPGSRGELLTTAQMAERLGIAPKTLLKHKAAGTVSPPLQRGKLIRWKGDEMVR